MIGATRLATQSRPELDIPRNGRGKVTASTTAARTTSEIRAIREKETTNSKSNPTSCSGNHDVMAKQVQTVVGKTLVGRGTSSACKRSRSQPSAFHQGQQPKAASKGRMYGSNLTLSSLLIDDLAKRGRPCTSNGATIPQEYRPMAVRCFAHPAHEPAVPGYGRRCPRPCAAGQK
jgi:hypothetical protein